MTLIFRWFCLVCWRAREQEATERPGDTIFVRCLACGREWRWLSGRPALEAASRAFVAASA